MSDPAMPSDSAPTLRSFQGQLNDKPTIVRINQSFSELFNPDDYHHAVKISIQFNEPGDDGLPTHDTEREEIAALEDLLTQRFRAVGPTELALTLSTDGVETLYFYSGDPESVVAVWEGDLQTSIESHTVYVEIERDDEWLAYRKFASAFSLPSA